MSEVDELARIREFNVDRAELVERDVLPPSPFLDDSPASGDFFLRPRRSLSRENNNAAAAGGGGGRSNSGPKYNIETKVDKGRLLNFSDELERERRRAEMALNRPRNDGPLRPRCTAPCQSAYLNDLAKPKPVPVEEEPIPQPPRLAVGGGGGGNGATDPQRSTKLKLLAPPPRPEAVSTAKSPLTGVAPTRTPFRQAGEGLTGTAASSAPPAAPRANRRQSSSPHVGSPAAAVAAAGAGGTSSGGSRKTSALLHAMKAVATAPTATTNSRHTGMTVVKTAEEEERVRHTRLHDHSTAWNALPQHYNQLDKVQLADALASSASSASSSPQPVQGYQPGVVAISTTVLDAHRAADYGIVQPPSGQAAGGRGGGAAAASRRPAPQRGGKSSSTVGPTHAAGKPGGTAGRGRGGPTSSLSSAALAAKNEHQQHPPHAHRPRPTSPGASGKAAATSESVSDETAALKRFEYNSSAEAVPVLRRPSSVADSSVSQDSKRPERRVHIDPTATTVIEVDKVVYDEDEDEDEDQSSDVEIGRAGARVSSKPVPSIASDPNEEPVMPDPPVKVVARRNRSAEPMQWPPPSYTEPGMKLSPVQLRVDGEGSAFSSPALYGTNHLSTGRAPAVVVVRRLNDSDEDDDGDRKRKGKSGKKSKK